jgi:protein-disulfide isomerase
MAEPEPVKESSPQNLNPLWLGFTIALVFIVGLALGFFGRPVVIKDLPIEVVVTVVPGENQAVAQTAIQASEADPAESQANVQDSEASGEPGQPTPTIMDFVLSDARHFQGNEAANVTVIEFSDFNCGFCGKFFSETLDQLRADYVDTGKVRFAYKHFAILGPDSTRAAEASECASEQDKFWVYHDSVFYNRVSGRADLSAQSLIAQAANLELDMDRFSECLESGKYTNQINQEALSVQSMGVKGTPAFLINGVFISGAQPYEVFQQVIDEQLASLEN